MSDSNRQIDETAASWSYAELWDKYPIPARPDAEELAIEEQAIKGSKVRPEHLKLMVLGSTIEYRSLCKHLGINPYVVDFAKENFTALSAYSREKFEHEHFVEADWLKLNYENFFDFILGHRPFNVIRHDQVLSLLQKMYSALKPGGTFFCRGNVKFPGNGDSLEKIIKKWAFAKNRSYRLFSYVEVALYIHCADERGYLNYPKARDVITNFYKHGKINEQDYQDIMPLISMQAGTKFRSFIAKNVLENYLTQAGFKKAEWLFTSHEFTKNMPIIKLTK